MTWVTASVAVAEIGPNRRTLNRYMDESERVTNTARRPGFHSVNCIDAATRGPVQSTRFVLSTPSVKKKKPLNPIAISLNALSPLNRKSTHPSYA